MSPYSREFGGVEARGSVNRRTDILNVLCGGVLVLKMDLSGQDCIVFVLVLVLACIR
jgi:hypothetical protein